MENRAHAFAAGLFVIVLGLCVAATAWWFSGKRESTKQYVLVTQRAVSGLNPQAQVRFRGIRAGKVEDIDLDPKDTRNILVRISVDADIPVTRGTTAQLNSQGITGLAYILLDDDGSSQEPLLSKSGEPPRIALKPSALDAIGDRASELVTRLNTLLDERSVKNMQRTVENLATASEGLKEMPRILAGVREVLNKDNIRRLQQLLAHLERTMGEAAPLATEVRGLVASLKDLSKRFDQVAGDAGGEMTGTTLPRLNALLGELQQNSRQLNRVLDELEDSPQALIFGRAPPRPGPGETGFAGSAK